MEDPELLAAFDEFQRDVSAAYGDIPARREEENAQLVQAIQAIGQQNSAALQQSMMQVTTQLAGVLASLQKVMSEVKKAKNVQISDIKTDGEGNVTSAKVVVG